MHTQIKILHAHMYTVELNAYMQATQMVYTYFMHLTQMVFL